MTNFTKEQYDILKAEATEILKNIAGEPDVRAVMARIYVDNLDEKTLKQGELMADGILQSVKSFDAGYQEAQEDLDRFIQDFQKKADEGRSCAERCNYWLKLGAAVSAADAALTGGGVDREALIQELEALNVSEEEATPEREAELRNQAAEAIRNSGILLGTLAEQAKALEALDDAEEAAGLLVDFGTREIEYRAVAAMLAYTKIKNGSFEGMPVDMTAAQVTAIVCAEAEQARIMEAVGTGSMAVDVAVVLLFLLGTVLLAELALSVVVVGTAMAAEFAGIVLMIPACLMIVGVVLHLFNKAADAWMEECEAVVKLTAAGIRWVAKGMAAVAGFVTGTVIPRVVQTASGIREKLSGLGKETAGLESEVIEG